MAFLSDPISLFAGGLFLLVACIASFYRVQRRPISKIPGPWISKWTDVVTRFHWLRGVKPLYVHELHQRYGSLVRLGPNEVSVIDIAAVREMYSVKNEYLKSDWYTKLVPPGVVNVFSTTDVHIHRRHRKLLSHAMSESSLKLVEPTVRAKAKLAIDRMQQEMQKRGVADIYKWSLFYTTDVIGELSFGESFRMLEIGQKNTYVEDLENVSRRGGIRAGLPELAFIARYIPLPFMSSAVESGKRFLQYSTESIQRYKRLVAADPNTPATLFSKLFRAGEEGMSDEEIISTGQGYIVAGSDTTSNTLTYLLWTVCRSPQTKAALLAELATLPADFDADALRELPYLNQVIEETLRLYSQVPGGLPRVVPPGGAYMAGHWVPPGTTVSAQAYSVHRNPGVFPRPEVFEPSRWAAPTKAMTDSFVPFGGGSRICIGLHLARMELRLGTALFFLRFPNARVSTKEGMSDGDMETILYFLMAPKGNRCLLELE